MNKNQRRALAEAERRNASRASAVLRLGFRARNYAGETPLDAGPKYIHPYTMGEHQVKCSRGRVESRGGKLKLVSLKEKDEVFEAGASDETRAVMASGASLDVKAKPEEKDAVVAARFPLPTDASAIDWKTERHVATPLVRRPASMPRVDA